MPFKNFWEFLNTDISKFSSIAVSGGQLVVDFAETLKENLNQKINEQNLQTDTSSISSLLDFLTSPPLKIVASGLPFVSIAVELLDLYSKFNYQEPSLRECIFIVSNEAYLKALTKISELEEDRDVLYYVKQVSEKKNLIIKSIELTDTTVEINNKKIEFNEQEAKNTLVCFHESKLAKLFNYFLTENLHQAGLNQKQAQILSQRVAHNTPRYVIEVMSRAGDSVRELSNLYCEGWRRDLDKYRALDKYLTEEIKEGTKKCVLKQNFTLKEIYVPLNACYLDDNGNRNPNSEQPLENIVSAWLEEQRSEAETQKIMFIQAEPGRGKSVFCQIYADWVRAHLYPIWTPILIHLRDIPILQKSFRATLKEAIHYDFATDNNWLTDPKRQFLFLLDGFDELLMEGRSSQGLETFLKQVGQFQKDYQDRHRVLITGRTLALQGIDRNLPYNLERVEILPMDNTIQEQWLSNWDKLTDKNQPIVKQKTLEFRKFLQHPNCPEELRGSSKIIGLAQEPLLLCLMAIMHRDGNLNIKMFEENKISNKISIYQTTIDWMLARITKEYENLDIKDIDIGEQEEQFQQTLRTVGLCVIQSGGEFTSIKMVQERLRYPETSEVINNIQPEKLKQEEKLKRELVKFYLHERQQNSLEFIHKSLGEFFCAAQFKESLEDWSEPGRRDGKKFNIPRDQMNREIYDLFGYGGLSQEIVQYLIELLKSSSEFDDEKMIRLFNRLKNFYFCWCNGEFIDAITDNYPRNKMEKINKYLEDKSKLSLRAIDIYTGLNVLILLLELYRYARSKDDKLKEKMSFYPCEKDLTQLLRIIGYSNCLGGGTLARVVGPFMSYIRLNDADLSGADLGKVNLLGAHLSRANLNGAYLRGANLKYARLKDTTLKRVNLDSANLTNAFLIDANLSSASLSNANLNNATLCGANLSDAKLNDANLSLAYLGGTNCRDANFNRANLSEAQLCSTDLSSANLKGTNLENADFRGSNLDKIVWDWATRFDNAIRIKNKYKYRNLSQELEDHLSKNFKT
ncbi:MAG: pentapeptide repeat-containing protein [Xenococcaceae cyanobacterium MO_188.B29]|nr:pentapeptide repeat-containing protein [Xenococcaceae cyanobacterium MO_188.B29]